MGSTTARWWLVSWSWRWRATLAEPSEVRGGNERSRRDCAGFSVMRRRTNYFLRAAFFAPFFAAFLRAPPFFAPPFFADDLRPPFFASFFLAAMVVSSDGVERSIEPP